MSRPRFGLPQHWPLSLKRGLRSMIKGNDRLPDPNDKLAGYRDRRSGLPADDYTAGQVQEAVLSELHDELGELEDD